MFFKPRAQTHLVFYEVSANLESSLSYLWKAKESGSLSSHPWLFHVGEDYNVTQDQIIGEISQPGFGLRFDSLLFTITSLRSISEVYSIGGTITTRSDHFNIDTYLFWKKKWERKLFNRPFGHRNSVQEDFALNNNPIWERRKDLEGAPIRIKSSPYTFWQTKVRNNK